jgi:hypothetical protein
MQAETCRLYLLGRSDGFTTSGAISMEEEGVDTFMAIQVRALARRS